MSPLFRPSLLIGISFVKYLDVSKEFDRDIMSLLCPLQEAKANSPTRKIDIEFRILEIVKQHCTQRVNWRYISILKYANLQLKMEQNIKLKISKPGASNRYGKLEETVYFLYPKIIELNPEFYKGRLIYRQRGSVKRISYSQIKKWFKEERFWITFYRRAFLGF